MYIQFTQHFAVANPDGTGGWIYEPGWVRSTPFEVSTAAAERALKEGKAVMVHEILVDAGDGQASIDTSGPALDAPESDPEDPYDGEDG